MNPCSSSQTIYKPDSCPSPSPSYPPAPTPAPSKDDTFAKEVLTVLFKVLKITDKDPSTCVNDVGNSAVAFRSFGKALGAGSYKVAVSELSSAMNMLSASVADCGTQEVQTKLDA